MEAVITPITPLYFQLAGEELTVLRELLESEHSRLLVEIRHTDHRSFREDLRHRLGLLEHLLEEIDIP
jgi:hypothetical protein